MKKHAEFLRPRFECVEESLPRGWAAPVALPGRIRAAATLFLSTAPRFCQACGGALREMGVKLTTVGATWPYGEDPRDTNIRIAPSYPTVEELSAALDVLVLAVKLVSAELAAEALE